MPIRKEDLRKVKISKHHDGSGDHVTNGYFHEWGKFPHHSETGVVQNTGAVVELEDGRVQVYDAYRLKFVDNF